MLQAEADVARRVAFAAMAERGGEIGAAVPLRGFRGVRDEAPALEERRIPERHGPALIEREAEIVRADWAARSRGRVMRYALIASTSSRLSCGIRGVGKGGIQVLPVLADALAHRAHELIVAVGADAVLRIGRDVGRIDRAERQLERDASGKRLARIRHRVAGDAVGRLGRDIRRAPRGPRRPARRRSRAPLPAAESVRFSTRDRDERR